MSGIPELSFLILILGAKGFTRGGLPFSSRKRLTGTNGRVAGTLCILAGLAGLGFSYWGSDPPGRERLLVLGQGILVGLLGAFLFVGWSWIDYDDEPPFLHSP